MFKLRKYTKLHVYGGHNVWFAEMTEIVAKKMFNPLSTLACTVVTVLVGRNQTMAGPVAEFNVCQNPSVLPQPEHKVKVTYCISVPPSLGTKDGQLSVGMSLMVPYILYHLHNGVDLFVIYVPFTLQKTYLQLLKPLIDKYNHRLLFIDVSPNWGEMKVDRNPRGGQGGAFMYELQGPLGQDCLNRMKGHSRFLRTIDPIKRWQKLYTKAPHIG